MARYVPPSMRKELTVDQKLEESINVVRERNDKDFPLLGGSQPVVNKSNLEYSQKAKEWEEKRQAFEIKERVDARMAEIKAEKDRREKEEMELLPVFRKRRNAVVETAPPVVIEAKPKAEDEWVTVDRKPYKPKKANQAEATVSFDDFDGLVVDDGFE
jgi:hypothetical protein